MSQEQRELERLSNMASILDGHKTVRLAKTDRTGFVLDVVFTDDSKYRLTMVGEKKPPTDTQH